MDGPADQRSPNYAYDHVFGYSCAVSSLIAPPIRPPGGRGDRPRRPAPERAPRIGLREAPAAPLGCGRRRSEAAALAMG
jgi:hypothetical protein